MKAFLLLGQSNMSGRGLLAGAPPVDLNGVFKLVNGRWQPAWEPLCADRPFAGVGPGTSFAEAYVREFREDCGLISCSEGGSYLEDWKPGSQLYLSALYCTKLAKNISQIAGILWHQGEGDSDSAELASSWGKRLYQTMEAFKKDAGAQVPVMMGELGDYLALCPDQNNQMPYHKMINRGIHELAEEHEDYLAVAAADLPDRGDRLHFSAAAQRELGRRYFEAYKKYLDQQAK